MLIFILLLQWRQNVTVIKEEVERLTVSAEWHCRREAKRGSSLVLCFLRQAHLALEAG